MYRLQDLIRNYHLRLRAVHLGEHPHGARAAEPLEPIMTARTRQVIEQRVAFQIRRRLIQKALEEA